MNVFPAVDLIGGQAVRLFQGDYSRKTVYDANPVDAALRFSDAGAEHIHIVDLDGAKSGKTDNFAVIRDMVRVSRLRAEVGGGVRSFDTVEKYLDAGVERVIIGTRAVTDPFFVREAIEKYGDRVAVGADIKDGFVAVKGWTEKSPETGEDFCRRMDGLGVKTLIVTDISRDGAMQGTNHDLYRRLTEVCACGIVASGGVSTLEEIRMLREEGLSGVILGKALYTGAIDLKLAIEVCAC